MITKLTGILDLKETSSVVIDVGGVGYYVHVSQKTLSKLSIDNPKIVLWIEHIIRQDDQMLCGFLTTLERNWFRLLVSVQGVGPKVALSILSHLSLDELSECILRQNSKPLTAADGVGTKVASRITLELKGKAPYDLSYPNETSSNKDNTTSETINDALMALCQLGYTKTEAQKAIASITSTNHEIDTSSLIRLSLQKLSKTTF